MVSDPFTPRSYNEALKCKDGEEWKVSMKNEIENFVKRGSWKMVLRSEVEKKGRKIIKTKKVFKIKVESDGSRRLKTRDVVLGFMQIPVLEIQYPIVPTNNIDS